ncbi:hypothetical protein SAMN05216464_11098 [Mucilaginibacter pineti]|uniref:Uncharacterized protein n=1 Tax=Mucilaginibacter pineti TaxID=1391627 RepID=A0A1G7GE08_9SPHI|nr:hypothetical protein [Mucilaginibacter pineti]SDE86313.1 hypothetical protein SAMN05216464_11098 [Mucilaginibacter pineti]
MASLIVLLAACTKETKTLPTTHDNQGQVTESLRIKMDQQAANPKNPFDYIGYYHNIGLDSLRHFVKANKDTTRAGKYAYLSRYFKLNFGEDVKLVYRPKEKLACTDYKSIWLNQKVSPAAQGYWKALSEVPQTIKDLNHYDAYKQQLTAIESKIMADKLGADEKKNLLMTAAILRYSGYYWINAFANGEVAEHSGGSGMAMPDSFLRKIGGVITGICADASVVAAGYISGDYSIIGDAILWSEVCGYYTGWW